MDSKHSTDTSQPSLPFGAIDDAPSGKPRRKKASKKKAAAPAPAGEGGTSRPERPSGSGGASGGPSGGAGAAAPPRKEPAEGGGGPDEARRRSRRRRKGQRGGTGAQGGAEGQDREGASFHGGQGGGPQAGQGGGSPAQGERAQGERAPGTPSPPGQGKRRRSRNKKNRARQGGGAPQTGAPGSSPGGGQGGQQGAPEPLVGGGMYAVDKGGVGVLRREEDQWCPSKQEIYVPKRLIQQYKLQEGSIVEGKLSRGQKHKYQLQEITSIDGKPPGQLPRITFFKNLTSIDPDFHYAVGDSTDNVSMRIVDLLCPIGRGQRGLIVAPPRSGKTTLLREFAHGIETTYPDVHLMVLLIDERPEEATEWRRSVKHGKVFVSTADETSKHHIQVAEAVWKRCMRLVELGEDVVLLLDSITRLARAYNNQSGAGGRTMSGGLDSRAMEKPRKLFGSARNTEKAGSLTILGTTLVDTGSRMDQLVFEEFKGTGNMELVLSRKLADRRVFPAIDVERSGTRKEEKLVGMRRLRLIHVLRRVLSRMNFVEAMELLITRLSEVEKTDDFLKRFEVDPEA